MVTLPHDFVATKYPGYYWNTTTETLFTAKLGVLRQLKYYGPNQWNYYTAGYQISDKGIRKKLPMSYLRSLRNTESVFPADYKLVVGQKRTELDFSMLPKGTTVTVTVR